MIMKYLVILLALLTSCATPSKSPAYVGGAHGMRGPTGTELVDQFNIDAEDLVERTVRANKRKYRPGHGLKLRGNQSGYKLVFVIPIQAWYSPRVNTRGDNAEQWNKLGGVSLMNLWPFTWGPPNKNAVLVAFRPALESGKFEIAAYINHPDRSWTVELLMIVEPDVLGVVLVDNVEGDEWIYEGYQGSTWGSSTLHLDPMIMQYNVGPWFGGGMKALHEHSVKTLMIFD